MNLLNARQLTHTFHGPHGPVAAIDQVNLDLNTGELVALHGASGSGKTTLLLALGGLRRPTGGQVLLEGEDLYAHGDHARLRATRIGFVLQTLDLVPYLSAIENAAAAPGATRESTIAWLDKLGLHARHDHLPAALSQGERQRVALARALAHNPAVILADEPTGNLDPDNRRLVWQTLRASADAGCAVLVATHDAAPPATRMIHLKQGILS